MGDIGGRFVSGSSPGEVETGKGARVLTRQSFAFFFWGGSGDLVE